MQTDETGGRTITAATIVVSLGVILVVMAVTGLTNNYLREWFRPVILLSGIALAGLGGWTLWGVRTNFAVTAADSPMRATAWALFIPVILATCATPDPLGTAMVNSEAVGAAPVVRVGRNVDGSIAYEALSADSPNEVTLEDLTNRFMFGAKEELEGKPVEITGFAVPAEDGTWRLSRFKIYCCAADAIPYSADILSTQDLIPDEWYTVEGTVDTVADPDKPTVVATKITPITQPKVPYL